MNKVIKLYTEKKYLIDGQYHEPILYPFWGFENGPYKTGSKHESCFDEYIQKGVELYAITQNKDDSDAFLLPGNFEGINNQFTEIYNESKKYKKPLIIFLHTDSSEKIPLNDVIIFRVSLNRSTKTKNEHTLPVWTNDYFERFNDGNIVYKNKSDIPLITYTGYVDYITQVDRGIYFIKEIIKRILGLQKEFWWKLRGKTVRALLNSNLVKMDFIQRKHFSGYAGINTWIEFINKIINSDYSLDIRGNGNASTRFYEILSCGKIPLYLDTDGSLPFDEKIDYFSLILKFNEDEIKNLDTIVYNFHNNISNEEFIARQKKLRKIYEDYISPYGFFSSIREYIINYKA